MVQRPNKNIKIIGEFKKKIGLKNAKFILFGSRARGSFHENSDFDIIVISEDFEGIPWYKRQINFQMNWGYDLPLEVLCFTPAEIKKLMHNRWGIVREALQTGIEV
ncbi:MAG: nucleotidyltransferase domain-containing protein [Nanoarchaeota archaeon]|nr:nucleotidyltransferase domain-containing protein [Nanoarchaeota archaeon]MBU4087002.1 nucleotidyltransferase domain-containing protein [Nanoarchaeota archaeon]